MQRSFAIGTCMLLFLLAVPTGAPAAERRPLPKPSAEYTITVIPYYSPEKLWTKFAPFVDHLKRSTGLPWELKLYPTHAALLDGLCRGEVSFALLGPVPLARAIDRCGVGVAAVALGKDGQPFYRSVIVTTDPAVRVLADLRGRQFGLLKGSTAAHIVPLKMLHDARIADADIVPVFLESQDHIMNALLRRDIAGAGVKDTLYQKFRTEPLLRVLGTSEPLPGFAFAVTPKANAAIRKHFSDALLGLDPRRHSEHRTAMQDWDDEIKNGFVAPPPGFHASVMTSLAVYREILHED